MALAASFGRSADRCPVAGVNTHWSFLDMRVLLNLFMIMVCLIKFSEIYFDIQLDANQLVL